MILWSANNLVTLVTAVLFVSALGTPNQARAAEIVTPALNKEATAQVGTPILHQGTYYEQVAIHLSEGIKFGERHQYSLTPQSADSPRGKGSNILGFNSDRGRQIRVRR